MPHYVGLDASKATTSICIVDEKGEKVREGVVETEPRAIVDFLRGDRLRYRRVGIESISFAPWLYEGLARAGLPVICIEARHAHAFLKGRLNKTDRNDAQGIAELMRAGLYKAVHVKTRASQEVRLLLAARRHLREKTKALDGLIRGALLQFGLKIDAGRAYSFAERADALAPAEGALREVVGALLAVRREIVSQVAKLQARLESIALSDPVCVRFMTAPGVGPLTALTFKAAIDVPQRFARSRDVGVHLGMTPPAFRSGTIVRRRRISKCGDESARTALFLAAQSVLRKRTHPSSLKTWGLAIAAARGSYNKAVIAVARRLAVTLHRMWLDGTNFRQEPIHEIGRRMPEQAKAAP